MPSLLGLLYEGKCSWIDEYPYENSANGNTPVFCYRVATGAKRLPEFGKLMLLVNQPRYGRHMPFSAML